MNGIFKIIFLILMLLNISCSNSNKGKGKKIGISFLIEKSLQNIKDTFKISFVNGQDSYDGFVIGDSIQLPELNKTIYSISFLYKSYNLRFDSVFTTMIIPKQGMNWIFGIDKKPFNELLGLLSSYEYKNDTSTKELYYMQFEPEGLDGIQIVKKVR
jgi:hypothetical protein